MEITENKLLATQKRAKSGEFRGQFLLNFGKDCARKWLVSESAA
jgi:hypothetical protein